MRSLRAKVTLVLLALLSLSFLVLWSGMTRVVNERFAKLEERDVRINLSRLEEVLQNRMSIPANKIPDWAN